MMPFRQPEHALCRLKSRSKSLVHINRFPAPEGVIRKLFMKFRIVRGKYGDAVAFIHDFLNASRRDHPGVHTPLFERASFRMRRNLPGISKFKFIPQGRFRDHFQVIVRVPFINEIVDETDCFFHGRTSSLTAVP